jgi:hypothetical protein
MMVPSAFKVVIIWVLLLAPTPALPMPFNLSAETNVSNFAHAAATQVAELASAYIGSLEVSVGFALSRRKIFYIDVYTGLALM